MSEEDIRRIDMYYMQDVAVTKQYIPKHTDIQLNDIVLEFSNRNLEVYAEKLKDEYVIFDTHGTDIIVSTYLEKNGYINAGVHISMKPGTMKEHSLKLQETLVDIYSRLINSNSNVMH